MRGHGALAVVLGLILLAVSACDGSTGTRSEVSHPLIVATTTIVGDLAAVVAGQEAAVEVLIPVGADPSTYEPTPEQTRRLSEADLVVASGLGLEAGLAQTLDAAEHQGVAVLRLGESLSPLPAGDGTDQASDPYWWMDPLRAAGAVSLIADRMTMIRSGDWVARALAADGRLVDLDRAIRVRLARCEAWPRQLITSQPGIGYFAERYDCLVESAAMASDPSSEASGETPVAVFIDSLGGPGTEAETYEEMMLANADRIAHAGPTVLIERAPAGPGA